MKALAPALAAILLALALAACGARGDLEPPPDSDEPRAEAPPADEAG